MPTSRPAASPDCKSWLDNHGDVLYRYAYARVFDAAAAEDIVQETLLAAWRARHEFRGQSAERTWLIGILKHKLIDHLRRRTREQPLTALGVDDDEALDRLFHEDPGRHWRTPPSPWADPDAALEQSQFWRAFQDCLAALPPRQAALFAASELEGLSGAELCKVADATATNVWVMLHRARLRLRQCLERNWFARHEAGKK